MGLNPFLDDISRHPPQWVLTADLPDWDHPAHNLELLRNHYEQVGDFHTDRIFAWASLGERGAPHDWKYTHPHMTLYRRRP